MEAGAHFLCLEAQKRTALSLQRVWSMDIGRIHREIHGGRKRQSRRNGWLCCQGGTNPAPA